MAGIESKLTKYPSTADAINANWANIEGNAQKTAEKLFPNYPDAQERYVSGVMRGVERYVTQQRASYEVDAHVVQDYMLKNHPISEDELKAGSPEIAAAYDRLQLNNPYVAASVERMFDANAGGVAKTFGSEVNSYMDRVLAPATDPNRITNPTQLYPYVGKGDHAGLTNTGANMLAGFTKITNTPQGEAFAAQTRSFFHQVHGTLTFSNPGTGITDIRGEALYSRFLAQATPILLKAYQSGSYAQLFDPKSPDYLGKLADTFRRSDAQVMHDRQYFSATGRSSAQPYTVQTLGQMLDRLDNDQQRIDFLRSARANGSLTADVYRSYFASRNGQPASAPGQPDFGDGGALDPMYRAAHPGQP